MYWDSSALLPYLVPEAHSVDITTLLEGDGSATIWWASPVECVSALERRRRDGGLEARVHAEARSRLFQLLEQVAVVQPHFLIRERAERLLAIHPLRAADALQLAAALIACDERPRGESFVTFDARLRLAAEKEGFRALPGMARASGTGRTRSPRRPGAP